MSSAPRRSSERARQPRYVVVGRVVRPHGVRGGMLLEPVSGILDTLDDNSEIYLGDPPQRQVLTALRRHGRMYRMQLAGCDDRDTAEAFRGQVLQVKLKASPALPAGRYYHWQIVGLRVVSEEGQPMGEIRQILETGANDVYIVATPGGGELLLPAITSVVRNVDLAAGEMTIRMIPGLTETTRKRKDH